MAHWENLIILKEGSFSSQAPVAPTILITAFAQTAELELSQARADQVPNFLSSSTKRDTRQS